MLPRLSASLQAKGGDYQTPTFSFVSLFAGKPCFPAGLKAPNRRWESCWLAEAGAAVERSPEDLREVGNYVVALETGIERLKTLPLSLRFVRELHAKLMTGVRGQHATPGEFRRTQNWIGRPGDTLAQATY